jgi:hypothetical protein
MSCSNPPLLKTDCRLNCVYIVRGERSSAGRASVCGCKSHLSRPLVSITYNPVIWCNSGYLVGFWSDLGTDWVRDERRFETEDQGTLKPLGQIYP